jgi:beta-1,4-mannosyl-glycoprotein beta-1,4-N-acetylglucosaminyltransferase
MKIYDIFDFTDQYDILDIRLNYLNDIVDYFVINTDKENDIFNNFKDKIIFSKDLQELQNNDIIIKGNIEEIPNKKIIEKYKNIYYPKPISLIQEKYFFHLNCKILKPYNEWEGTIITTKKYLDDNNYQKVKNGGWYFSHLGDINSIIFNIGTNNPAVRIETDRQNLFNPDMKYIFIDMKKYKDDFPDYLIDNLEKFKKHIKETNEQI